MDMFGNLGPALRLLREQRRLTQAALARSAGVGKSQLSKYESGKEKPKLDSLARLLQVLGVTGLDFFALTDLLDKVVDRLERAESWQDSARLTGSSLLPPEIQQEFEHLLRALFALQASVVRGHLRLDEEPDERSTGPGRH